MTKSLLIVESPTKEKTIGKMLGKDCFIKSSYGHIRDLPAKKFGIDIEKGFAPQYETLPKAKKILPELTKIAKKVDIIFLATDYDREGEAIAWHLAQVLKLPKEKVKRITFHEITSKAIKEAMKNPRKIDDAMVNAQVARRILDRVVGYRLSPLLWKKVRRGLSAGRVQSVAVRLICIREEEIGKFNAEEYWTLTAFLEKLKQDFSANLHSDSTKKFDKFAFRSKDKLQTVLDGLKGASYIVKKIDPKERKRSPQAPFTTASLQQDASRRLHFTASRTMRIAQQLYEGVDLGGKDGQTGLITYMRTDSVQVAKEAQQEAVKWIKKEHGDEYVPPKPRVYKTKSKQAQEAHEAIRPTTPSRTPESIKKSLTKEQYKLYELIWQRFMGSQMTDARYDTLSVDIEANKYIFRATGRTLKFPGFLTVYGETVDEDAKKDDDSVVSLPALKVGDVLDLKELKPEQHFTEPPPRYNEASLVKTLEENGIGRPSTYAPIIQTILDRGYVRLEERRFYPTELGKVVDEQLKNHFPNIVNIGFTAELENELDSIATSEDDWQTIVQKFYKGFAADLERAETKMLKVQIKPQQTDEKCPRCQSPMVLRENRFGRYLACTQYPSCRSTIPLDRQGNKVLPKESSEVCPKCSKPMVLKIRGRSQFLACTGYPTCRTTFSVDKDGNKIVRPEPVMTDEKCNKCSKPMLLRVGKRGPFLACSGFPRCRNIKKVKDEGKAAPKKKTTAKKKAASKKKAKDKE